MREGQTTFEGSFNIVRSFAITYNSFFHCTYNSFQNYLIIS